ncbi:ARM repeat-containing protein [Auriculariales sp. MPI-PUGE-AT-0066]|nr:ARM repeat-containing protein [Auriculariales sp. MPI-PUGE-AT-0066]
MDESDSRVYSSFEKADEFFMRLDAFLKLDVREEPASQAAATSEYHAFIKLQIILMEYQEQSFLLDPFLERMVAPPVNILRQHVADTVNKQAKWCRSRLENLVSLIYSYCRVRGQKAIVRFFPHEVSDLPIVIAYMSLDNGPVSRADWWNLRCLMLLWMSLICMVPFDLHRFDGAAASGTTLDSIQTMGKGYLAYAGIEREMAAIMLARLYTRKDTNDAFREFLAYSQPLVEDSDKFFAALGVLKALCEYCNSQSADKLIEHVPAILDIANRAQGLGVHNSTVRKLRLKLISRLSMKLLPPPRPRRRGFRGLMGIGDVQTEDQDNDLGEDIEVPEEVESAVADALQLLEDKDTPIRWSASKAVARLAERLPREFTEQMFEQILGIFAENSWKSDIELLDLPPTAEFPWHGACLACAEFTRRDLVPTNRLADMIPWIVKALHFDIRKGSHSVGSSVRDAASYVLWSLARSHDLDVISQSMDTLARELVVTAIYDREVHIRRAASAAFQENVGRTGLFPDGIAVLAKVDFFTVGVRRQAFTIAAAEVAKYHAYRQALMDHVIDIVLQHWDASMRQSGAESLRAICSADPDVLGQLALQQLKALLTSVDIFAVSGGLLALSELATLYTDLNHQKRNEEHFKIFSALHEVPTNMLRARLSDLVLEGYCLVISTSVSVEALSSSSTEGGSAMPAWRSAIEQALRSRTDSVQSAAAQAMRRVSQLKNCSADGAMPQLQQGIIRALGALAYDAHPHGMLEAIHCLLGAVDSKSSTFSQIIESRQRVYEALPNILTTLGDGLASALEPTIVVQIYNALLCGLEDYTSDERGDVGSWVRMASIRGLVKTTILLFSQKSSLDLALYLPIQTYHLALAGILKQGIERLDNVRLDAGAQLHKLVRTQQPAGWEIPGIEQLRQLFLTEQAEQASWADGSFLFPRAARLLPIPSYRSALVPGFTLSIGSKTDSTQGSAAKALSEYASELPVSGDGFTLVDLIDDVLSLIKNNFSANHIAIPALQTFAVLAEAEVLKRLETTPDGQKSLEGLFKVAIKNADKIKNVQRIATTMRIVVSLIYVESMSKAAISALQIFLSHKFPKIRSDTAEQIYLALQSEGGDASEELEEVLLETEW